MLNRLHIQNYALIDQLSIEFHAGLNTITGETGAGKSILLGALALILGQRADTSILKDKSRGCVVEGLFLLEHYNLQEFFDRHDLDYHHSTIIRRQINESGKSRAFINEVPVTLPVLKELVERIIDIHSQHQHLLLADGGFQLQALDAFAGAHQLLAQYQAQFNAYKGVLAQLGRLREQGLKAKADLDYLSFQLSQLAEAKLRAGEQETLEAQQRELANAEEIRTALQKAAHTLDSDEESILVRLREAEGVLARVAAVYGPAGPLGQRIEACRIELRDVADEAQRLGQGIEADPSRLEQVDQRLNLIYALQQKHRVATVDELLAIAHRLAQEVASIENADAEVERLQKQLDGHRDQLLTMATALSGQRRERIEGLEQRVTQLLTQLGIPHAAFAVQIDRTPDFTPMGIDRVAFQFSANRQIPPQELARIASGGELSRLMLTLKSIMAQTKGLPTIIFDEIDAGISGEVAHRMGSIIQAMAQGMQVINITHLPQIASRGEHHFLVYKENGAGATTTQIRLLTPPEREVEIAKMLSGKSLSDAALANAKQLLYGS